jgi:hypothetical protein
VHIGLHKIGNNVDIFIASRSGRLLDVNQSNNVFVIKELQKLDFSDYSLGINEIFESFWHFLDGNLDLGLVIVCTAHHTICTMSNLLYILELIIDDESGTRAYERGLSLDLLLLDWSLDLLPGGGALLRDLTLVHGLTLHVSCTLLVAISVLISSL